MARGGRTMVAPRRPSRRRPALAELASYLCALLCWASATSAAAAAANGSAAAPAIADTAVPYEAEVTWTCPSDGRGGDGDVYWRFSWCRDAAYGERQSAAFAAEPALAELSDVMRRQERVERGVRLTVLANATTIGSYECVQRRRNECRAGDDEEDATAAPLPPPPGRDDNCTRVRLIAVLTPRVELAVEEDEDRVTHKRRPRNVVCGVAREWAPTGMTLQAFHSWTALALRQPWRTWRMTRADDDDGDGADGEAAAVARFATYVGDAAPAAENASAAPAALEYLRCEASFATGCRAASDVHSLPGLAVTVWRPPAADVTRICGTATAPAGREALDTWQMFAWWYRAPLGRASRVLWSREVLMSGETRTPWTVSPLNGSTWLGDVSFRLRSPVAWTCLQLNNLSALPGDYGLTVTPRVGRPIQSTVFVAPEVQLRFSATHVYCFVRFAPPRFRAWIRYGARFLYDGRVVEAPRDAQGYVRVPAALPDGSRERATVPYSCGAVAWAGSSRGPRWRAEASGWDPLVAGPFPTPPPVWRILVWNLWPLIVFLVVLAGGHVLCRPWCARLGDYGRLEEDEEAARRGGASEDESEVEFERRPPRRDARRR